MIELIDFLRSHAGFGNNVAAMREAVVKPLLVADADNIAEFVPVIVRIKAVRRLDSAYSPICRRSR